MFNQKKEGIALIAVILIITTLLSIGIIALNRTVIDNWISGNVKDIKKAFYLAEAGISHGTEYLKQHLANWATYTSQQTILGYLPLKDGNYMVTIGDGGGGRRRIVSTGLTRTGAMAQIEVFFGPVYTPRSHYMFAVFGDEGVRVTGDKNYVDSYDSDVGYIGEGMGRDGDIGTNSTTAGAIDIGNGDIYGDGVVGTGGDPNTIVSGPNGSIDGSQTALTEPMDMTPRIDPGGGTPIPDITNATTLGSGSYRVNEITLSGSGDELLIDGNVILFVNDIKLSGKATVKSGGSLVIYCFGSIQNTGQGFFNTSQAPKNLQIYGTATCTSIDVSGSANFYGSVFAPKADIAILGGGDFYGSAIGRTVELKGGASGEGGAHYDVRLADEDDYNALTDIVFISKRNL